MCGLRLRLQSQRGGCPPWTISWIEPFLRRTTELTLEFWEPERLSHRFVDELFRCSMPSLLVLTLYASQNERNTTGVLVQEKTPNLHTIISVCWPVELGERDQGVLSSVRKLDVVRHRWIGNRELGLWARAFPGLENLVMNTMDFGLAPMRVTLAPSRYLALERRGGPVAFPRVTSVVLKGRIAAGGLDGLHLPAVSKADLDLTNHPDNQGRVNSSLSFLESAVFSAPGISASLLDLRVINIATDDVFLVILRQLPLLERLTLWTRAMRSSFCAAMSTSDAAGQWLLPRLFSFNVEALWYQERNTGWMGILVHMIQARRQAAREGGGLTFLRAVNVQWALRPTQTAFMLWLLRWQRQHCSFKYVCCQQTRRTFTDNELVM